MHLILDVRFMIFDYLKHVVHKKTLLIIVSLFFVGAFGLIMYARATIMPYAQYIYHDMNELPVRDIAVVFGGGIERDGSQSDMQRGRVDAAIDVYKKGKVKKIMMTGDDGRLRFDEISAMVRYARERGVPVYDILTDPHGYRTYESCYREARVYQLETITAISQDFHLPRILYFCRGFGIDTVGFSADYQGYDYTVKMAMRETLARVKGWMQMEYTKPVPRVAE